MPAMLQPKEEGRHKPFSKRGLSVAHYVYTYIYIYVVRSVFREEAGGFGTLGSLLIGYEL